PHIRQWAVAAIEMQAAVHLFGLSSRHQLQLLFINALPLGHLFVHDAHASWRDRADTQLLVSGRAEFASYYYVQRCIECAGDLVTYDHAAPRQRKHDRILIIVSQDLPGKE